MRRGARIKERSGNWLEMFLLFGARVRLTGTCDVRAVGFFDLGQSVAGQVTRDLENEGK